MTSNNPTPERRAESPKQRAEWRHMVEVEGWPIKAIAARRHVRPETIRRALERADTPADVRDAQRRRRAVEETHVRDLLAEADRLRRAATWPPLSLTPRESLPWWRDQALEAHIGPVLEASLYRRIILARAYEDLAADLRRVLELDCWWVGSCLEYQAADSLMIVAVAVARGGPASGFNYSVQTGLLMEGPFCIQSQVESLDDPRAKQACADLERMARDLPKYIGFKRLRSLYEEWARLRETLLPAIEDLTRRESTPGSCTWCA
jgi:hypothetical protein